MVKSFLKERIGTIIFIVIVAAMVISGFFSIKKAKSNAITYSDEYEAPEATANLLDAGEYKSIAKTDKLELLYNDTKGAIQVINLENGHVWKGVCDEEVINLKKLNKQWAAYCQSPITISYNDLKKRDSGVKKVYAGKDCGYLESNYIENGVEVTYGFLTPGIYVTVQYVLDGDNLVVTVPWEKIEEKSKYAVTTVELLPYFGACANENDGYLFYPDGSGAITTYAKVGDRPSNIKQSSYYVYSHKSVSMANLMTEDNYDRYTAAMPVFGIKDGDDALFAFGGTGSENTGIVVYPSGYVINLNHTSFELYVRNVFNVDMYNISTESGSATGGKVQRVDKNLIQQDIQINYAFLSGDKANYSGMADVYRDYLLETGELKDTVTDTEYPLALSLLMGTEKEGVLFSEYVKMTDFEDAISILEDLKANGIIDTEVILRNWGDCSHYDYWGPNSHLGGKSGLKKLSDYLKENTHSDVFLESNFSVADDDTHDFNEESDVAYDGINIEVSWTNLDGLRTYLLNPAASFNKNAKFLKKLSKYEGIGVSYADVGIFCYADYNENNTFTKTETAQKLSELLKATKDENRKVAISGANKYTYASADFLYSLKEEAYGLSITDYSVPFVEMVISGLIPYATEGAGNLSYDLDIQKLRWIEFGALPSFYLTYESALNLRDTNASTLFSSTYEDWLPTVISTYNEFKSNFGHLSGQQMVEHLVISDDVRKVRYEDGTTIYLNYSSKAETADGITIPAKGYTVTGGTK